MTSAKTQQYHAVDVMKFVCAFLVIVVHTYPFYEVWPDLGFVTSNILGRIVIPFFFISAGYFMQIGRCHKDENYFRSYIKRLIKLYLIWSVIYIPFGMHKLGNMMEISGALWLAALPIALFNIGTYFHLWYMSALIFAMVFCHLFLKKFSMKALLILGGLLFLIGLVETYHGLITNEILLQSVNTYFLLMFTTRNGLFFGVLFVAMGMALADLNRTKTLRHPFIKAAAAFVLLVVEAFTVRHFHWALDYNMYLMTVPFILYWFAGLLQTQLNWKLNFKALREASTVIYFCHAMFLELGEILLGSLYLNNGAVRFFFVFPLTMILTFIIRRWLPFLK